MSTIQIHKQLESTSATVQTRKLLEKKGTKPETHGVRCIICTNPKVPCVFDEDGKPLVLKCLKCGHQSWASVSPPGRPLYF